MRHKDSYFNGSPKFWKSATGIGFFWEKWAAKELGATHLEFTKGADLVWNGNMVDVKVSNPFKRKDRQNPTNVWVFNRNSRKKKVDFFFCIALEDGEPIKKLLIPNDSFPEKGMVIGIKSKYDKYSLVHCRNTSFNTAPRTAKAIALPKDRRPRSTHFEA